MIVMPFASTGNSANAPIAGQATAFPAGLNQPQGDIYTSANDKEVAKKRAFNPINIALEAFIGGMVAIGLKNAGKNKLAIAAFAGFPLAGMALRAIGGMFDSEWDKKHPPNTRNQAIKHEIFRPSGLVDLALIGAGIVTLRKNVNGVKQGGEKMVWSLFDMDWMLLSPAIGIWDRYKEGKEKFAISGRGQK